MKTICSWDALLAVFSAFWNSCKNLFLRLTGKYFRNHSYSFTHYHYHFYCWCSQNLHYDFNWKYLLTTPLPSSPWLLSSLLIESRLLFHHYNNKYHHWKFTIYIIIITGTSPLTQRRERVVCDVQPSCGYMHAGYPVVTHLDIAEVYSKEFVMNSEYLRGEGSWGLYHEIGNVYTELQYYASHSLFDNVLWCVVLWYNLVWYHVTTCLFVACNVFWCNIMWCIVIWCNVM